MKKIKIALSAFAFMAAIGGAVASSQAPADLYSKNLQGQCVLTCASVGVQVCDQANQAYISLEACIQEDETKLVDAFRPF